MTFHTKYRRLFLFHLCIQVFVKLLKHNYLFSWLGFKCKKVTVNNLASQESIYMTMGYYGDVVIHPTCEAPPRQVFIQKCIRETHIVIEDESNY